MPWAGEDEARRRDAYLAEIDFIYRRRPEPLDWFEALLLRIVRRFEGREG